MAGCSSALRGIRDRLELACCPVIGFSVDENGSYSCMKGMAVGSVKYPYLVPRPARTVIPAKAHCCPGKIRSAVEAHRTPICLPSNCSATDSSPLRKPGSS